MRKSVNEVAKEAAKRTKAALESAEPHVDGVLLRLVKSPYTTLILLAVVCGVAVWWLT